MVRYVVLIESSTNEIPARIWFLQYDGNEKELEKLSFFINNVVQYIEEDTNCYVLDYKNPVSLQTAKEMCTVRLHDPSLHNIREDLLTKCETSQIINGIMKPLPLTIKEEDLAFMKDPKSDWVKSDEMNRKYQLEFEKIFAFDLKKKLFVQQEVVNLL